MDIWKWPRMKWTIVMYVEWMLYGLLATAMPAFRRRRCEMLLIDSCRSVAQTNVICKKARQRVTRQMAGKEIWFGIVDRRRIERKTNTNGRERLRGRGVLGRLCDEWTNMMDDSEIDPNWAMTNAKSGIILVILVFIIIIILDLFLSVVGYGLC